MHAAFDEAREVVLGPEGDRTDLACVDLTDHAFENGSTWRDWVGSRSSAQKLEGVQGARKLMVAIHPSAKDFEYLPKVYFSICGLDGIEALISKSAKAEDIVFQESGAKQTHKHKLSGEFYHAEVAPLPC